MPSLSRVPTGGPRRAALGKRTVVVGSEKRQARGRDAGCPASAKQTQHQIIPKAAM